MATAQAPTATVVIAVAVTVTARRVVARVLTIAALIAAAVTASRLGGTPVARALARTAMFPPAVIKRAALPRTLAVLSNNNPKMKGGRLNASKSTRPSPSRNVDSGYPTNSKPSLSRQGVSRERPLDASLPTGSTGMFMKFLSTKLMATQDTVFFIPISTGSFTKKAMAYMQTSHLKLHPLLQGTQQVTQGST